MKSRKIAIRITLATLVAVVVIYVVDLVGSLAIASHRQRATATDLCFVYRDLCEYRDAKGRWPEDLKEAAARQGSLLSEGSVLDPISHQPLRYYPGAKPGTTAILLAQPEALEVGLWPFVAKWRCAVRANGELVDLSGDFVGHITD